MTSRIFYSWQSDIRAAACRTLIEAALAQAVRELSTDRELEVTPVIDRDTLDVPGSPDIGSTIFAKIDCAAAFVGDVTIVGHATEGRPTPNPNVLIELGYALKALGEQRILLVQNVAFGGPELLPFDLRQKRVIKYRSDETSTDRTATRKELASVLKPAIASILNIPMLPTEISAERERWLILLRRAMSEHAPVEFETPILHELGVIDASGDVSRARAILDGSTVVRSVDDHKFEIAFHVRGRFGFTVIAVPFSRVDDIWQGTEGRPHVLLKGTLLLKNGSSAFV